MLNKHLLTERTDKGLNKAQRQWVGVEWKGGFEDSTGSVTRSNRGPGHHQPQCGHLPQLASLVGSESHVLASGIAEAEAAPWKAVHTGFPLGPS